MAIYTHKTFFFKPLLFFHILDFYINTNQVH